MKKSITLLAIALLAAGTAFAEDTVAKNETGSTSKYVSFADAKLTESEMGDLKKNSRTNSESIEADRKITEAAPVEYVYLPKKQTALSAPKLRN